MEEPHYDRSMYTRSAAAKMDEYISYDTDRRTVHPDGTG